MTTAEKIYQYEQVKYYLKKIDSLPDEIFIALFSDWAEENRYIPPGISDFYGQFDNSVAPHLVEILNRLHPDDPCTHIALMKSVQSAGTTTVAENAIGAYIRYKLGNILFLTSTKGIAAIRGSANIDTLIDNSNLAQYLSPLSNRTGKKNKDNTFYKEFMGGIKMLLSSYNSPGDLKSNTWHLIVRDEWDEAGLELKDQGDIGKMIEGRTKGIRNYKILDISTPTRAETSRIYKSYLDGDQRQYHVPCPLCGEKQTLTLKRSGDDYGLTFTREKDKVTGQKLLVPETVRYTCKYCKEDFYESKKQWMLQNGIWIPQVVPKDKKKHSYHAPGLIAPEPFLSWERICQEFIDADFGQDLFLFKDFTINVLGNPWAAIKKAAKWEALKKRAEDYTLSEVPGGQKINISGIDLYTGPMLLFGGVDVQGDRLELCVTGFGINSEKWIVDYQIFYGDTSDIDDHCWSSLDDYVYNHEYKILDKPINIEMCAVDAGYNPRKDAEKRGKDYAGKAHIVYEFVSYRTDRFMAIMGDPKDNAIGIIKESKITDTNTSLTKRYMVSVSLLKELIMSVVDNSEGHGTIHVPNMQIIEGLYKPIPDEFYQQFLSERYQEDPKKPGSYIWKKIRNRNEILDTFIYSIAAADRIGVTRWTKEHWGTYYFELVA